MKRLTPNDREILRRNIDDVAIATNPLTCRALLALLNERDELEVALQKIEELTWGGKGESAVHIIARGALRST